MSFLEIHGIRWDLSLMNRSYNLTKRTTKIKTFEKHFEMFILNFKTVRYKLNASGNIIHSVLIYKPMRTVSNLRLPKEQKQRI